MASGLIPLLNEMENRKEIQKAQKAPKKQKKTFWVTIVAAEKNWFFGFPRKKVVVFAMHGLYFFWKTNFFLGKSWFLKLRPLKNPTFS